MKSVTPTHVLRALWQGRIVIAVAAVSLLVVVMLAAIFYALNLPQFALDQQQTLVFGPTQFSPGDPAAVRVLVRDQKSAQPLANADVTVRLQPKGGGSTLTLYTGKTDESGSAPIAFTIPPETARDQTLLIDTRSKAGSDHVERAVVVQRTYKVLVTTDKPLYQPNQTIHLRALALGALDRLPAKQTSLEFLVEDPKGNKVFRQTVQTSDYGVASADFALADTITSGDYKVTASVGDTKSEKTVTVKPYVLPKFKVSTTTDKSYYLPGDRVSGSVQADYFFGKSVTGGKVTLKGVVYDVARTEMVNLTGTTDEEGAYAFSFPLPNYFAGSGLDKNQANFTLEISVTDQANHSEDTSLDLPIASVPIIIDGVPESGTLIPGVENIIYVLTSYPDGSPAVTKLTVLGKGVSIKTQTGNYGLAEIRVTPQSGDNRLDITAQDASGKSAGRSLTWRAEAGAGQILLRPDRATYRVGETMHLELFTTGGVGTVYLDVIKEGQTILTRAISASNSHAAADMDVTPDLVGTLQLHAYHVALDGTIVRDTRVVVVEASSELNVGIQVGQDTYRPGDSSHVAFNVTNPSGQGVQSALGVSAVDESVFALAEQDPGFAKLYFLLQEELLQPRYQIKGFSLPEVVTYRSAPPPPDVRAAQDQSAQAAWALTTPFDFILRADSQPEKRDAASKAQGDMFNGVVAWLALFLVLIPLCIGGFVITSLHAKGVLGRSFAWWMTAALVYCVVSPFAIGGIAIIGQMFIYARLGVVLVAAAVFAWLVGFGVLAAHAITKRDQWLQVALLLLGAYIVFLGMLFYVAGKAATFDQGSAFLVILAYLVALASVVLLGVGLLVQKETAPGIAGVMLAVLFIPATILLAILPSAGPFLRSMGNPAIYVPVAYITGCAPAGTPAPGGQGGNLFRDFQFGQGLSAPPPQPAAAPTSAPAPTAPAAGAAPGSAAAPPRLRQYFPETLYVNPQVITDENGYASLDIPLADSITTWRLSVAASSQKGELGSASAGIRVFQDFFVDLDLPVALTQNDEISIPVAVYNYLPQAQNVKLQIDQQPWFALEDDAVKTLTIASNDIDVVYFRIRAVQFGAQKLRVTALGEKMSDAIQREIRVYPDGKPFQVTQSNWLKGGTAQTADIPAAAIPGASRVEVKVYPGIMSQAVNGLDGLLKVPYG